MVAHPQRQILELTAYYKNSLVPAGWELPLTSDICDGPLFDCDIFVRDNELGDGCTVRNGIWGNKKREREREREM